jgi:CHAT domain-containing protein/tetratricopeptide (TPR) repeat protein
VKRFLALCLTVGLAAGAAGAEPPESKPAPLTREQQDKLKERDRLQREADRLRDDKPDEAIALTEKALALTREVRGEAHPETIDLRQALAQAYEDQANFPAAQKQRRQVLATLTRWHGKDHWQVTDARLALEGVERLARLTPADRRRLAEAGQLNGQALQFYQQRKIAAALPLAQKALEIQKQVLGERHPDYALSLNNLAALYRARGESARAEPLYRQALEIRKQLLGEHHPATATSLNNLALLYRDQGDYARAEPLLRQAVDICKLVLGEHDPAYAQSLNNLYAQSLNNLAALYQVQGEYARAEPLFRQALIIRKQVLGERHPDYAQSLNNLAALYLAQGEYARAEPLFRQAREIYQQVLGERHPLYATSLHNLAELYLARGDYAQAEPLYRQALDIYKQALGERHPHYAQSLNNLAALYRAQEDYARAEPLLRQALAIRKQVLGERHPDYAQSLNTLALLYKVQGEYGKAEPLYRRALEIQKQVLGERHPDYATSLDNLALLYQAQGEYARAEPLCRQAVEINKQVLGQRHPDYATSLNNLAHLYWSQGEYARAEPLLRLAVAAMCQRPEGPPPAFGQLTAADLRPALETVTCLASYAAFLEQRLGPRATPAQLRAADHALALALALRERLRQEVLQQAASKLQHGAKALDLIPRRIGLCQRLFAAEGRAADLESAMGTAEQGTARVFLEQLGQARALSVGRVSPELRAEEAARRRQLQELDVRIAREQDKPADKRDPDKVGRLLDEQKQAEAQLSELIRRLEKDYPQYAALQYPRPCSLAQARACLAASEVALLFVPGHDQSYAVLVEGKPAPADKANGLAIYPLPGQDDLAEGVSRLADRDTFEAPVKARAVARQAYDLLLAPLKERIRGKDLVIVPGGPLGYVPFEALVEDDRFLIEKHRIRYAPSLTALHFVRLWEQTRPRPPRPLWALADPVYDQADERAQGKPDLARASQDALAEYLTRAGRGHGAAESPYRRLRFTGPEAEAIRDLLGGAEQDVLTGLQASEATVKAASAKGLLARARYVHFATHGILGLDTGQPPALVLSLVGNDGARDADGGINDGFLRLDEVTRLRLNADLVVLSACETGKGKLYAGEGVTGLARAFLYAGSRGVVCSLWAVDDRETATFMAQLYGGLKDGKRAADALRAAKLAMIWAGKPPVSWAPFILIGE